MQDQHLFLELLPDQADRLGQVRVIRHNLGHLIIIVEGIHQKVGSEVDIRAFLLALHYLNRLRSNRWWRVQRHADRFFQIAAEVNRQVRNGPQGPKVDLLPPRLQRIIGAGGDVGREIANVVDLVSWRRKRRPAEGIKVKPLMRSPLQAAILEVEPVDIDVGFHP
jgi:hypothetical protein